MYVHLADSLAEYAVGHAHGAFPAGFLLGDTAHLSAEEVERCIVVVIRQAAGGGSEQAGCQVVLKLSEGGGGEQPAESVEERGLLYDDLVLVGEAEGLEEGCEVESFPAAADLSGAHRVVLFGVIAVLDAGPGYLSETVLYLHGVLRFLCCVFVSAEGEESGQHLSVALVQLRVGRVHVVVAVAHPEAALSEVEYLHLAVHKVSIYSDAEEAALSVLVHLSQLYGQGLLVLGGVDGIEIFLERLSALCVQLH